MSAFLLIGTIVSGLGSAGVVMLLFRLFGRRAPRWLLPTVAGIVMLTMHIALEQSWFRRLEAQLTDRVVVVETFEQARWWQPWTLIQPQIVRFSAIDRESVEPMDANLVRAELWLVDRRQGSMRVMQLYDCETPRRVDWVDAQEATALPPAEAWTSVPADDAIRRVACRLRGDG